MTAPRFEFSNPSLGYGDSPVLRNLSLSIAAGEKHDRLDRLDRLLTEPLPS